MKIEKIQRLQSLLETPNRWSLFPTPIQMEMRSEVAWLHAFLRQNKHDVHVISPNQYPDFLKWVPGSSSLSIYEENPIIANEKIAQADLIFTLDFNTLSRIGEMGVQVAASQAKKSLLTTIKSQTTLQTLRFHTLHWAQLVSWSTTSLKVLG